MKRDLQKKAILLREHLRRVENENKKDLYQISFPYAHILCVPYEAKQ